MNEKQIKGKNVSRRGFLKGTAAAAAAGGIITALPPISKAGPKQKKNPVFFREVTEVLGMMPENVARNYLVSHWPWNPVSNTVIEFIHVCASQRSECKYLFFQILGFFSR